MVTCHTQEASLHCRLQSASGFIVSSMSQQFHLWRSFITVGYLRAARNVPCAAFSREQIGRKPFYRCQPESPGPLSTMTALTCVSSCDLSLEQEVQRVQAGGTSLKPRFFPARRGQVWKLCPVPWVTMTLSALLCRNSLP